MSKASEWAKRLVKAKAMPPRLFLGATMVAQVGMLNDEVTPTCNIPAAVLVGEQALELARWINATFGEPK